MIKVENVTKEFEHICAVNQVSFEIPDTLHSSRQRHAKQNACRRVLTTCKGIAGERIFYGHLRTARKGQCAYKTKEQDDIFYEHGYIPPRHFSKCPIFLQAALQ